MHLKFIFTIYIFLVSFLSFSQNLTLNLTEKYTKEPIGRCCSFIIDPVDNAVVGFDISDFDGISKLKLIRPLLSDKFLVKLCDMHLVDSQMEFFYEDNKTYQIEWEVPKTIKWLTIYYNKTEVTDVKYEMDPYSCILALSKPYFDTLDLYNQRELQKQEKEYQRQYNAYLREIARFDSLSKIYPGIDYLVGPPPQPIDLPDLELYGWVSEQGDPPGGIAYYANKIFELNILKPLWRKKQRMTFIFKLHGFEFVADSLTVLDEKNVVMHKSRSIEKAMNPIMSTKWKPMKFNGNVIKFRNDINYTIEFIYRE